MTKNNEEKEKDLETPCPYHCQDKYGQCNNPSPENKHIYCLGNKNCIYKEYARKEQECEKANKNAQDTYELYQALMESLNILQDRKIELEQECERLKEEVKQLETDLSTTDYISETLKAQYKELKAENEELKRQLEVKANILKLTNDAKNEYLTENKRGRK